MVDLSAFVCKQTYLYWSSDKVGLFIFACYSYYLCRQAVLREKFHLKTEGLKLHTFPSFAPPPFFQESRAAYHLATRLLLIVEVYHRKYPDTISFLLFQKSYIKVHNTKYGNQILIFTFYPLHIEILLPYSSFYNLIFYEYPFNIRLLQLRKLPDPLYILHIPIDQLNYLLKRT